jgi:hypothetical protein
MSLNENGGRMLGIENQRAKRRAFLQASDKMEFDAVHRREVYEWMTRGLCEQEYWKQKRAVKGLLRR